MKRALVFAALIVSAPAFAAQPSPLAALDDAEQVYYEKIYDYVMDQVKDGNDYGWASHSGKGKFTIKNTFLSKSGSTCRNFHETYSIKGVDGEGEAVACKREGDNGWCKLRPDQAMTCAMEQPGGIFGRTMAKYSGTSYSAGGVGSVGSPNVQVGAPSGPNVNPNVNMPRSGRRNSGPSTAGNDVAHSVTDAAGSVAGPATGGAINWFNETFR